jgi:predicted enzyme related to lactoylglutathione lyase
MGQPIIHFEIIGKDARKLQKFYADVFNWKVGESGGPEFGFYAQVAGDSSGLPVGIGADPSGTARTTAYIRVPDLQATLDQAVSMGGKVVVPPTDIPGVLTFAHVADPEGNVIGLTKG